MILKMYDFNNKFMNLALEEAKKAYDKGEVPVGCIIVDRVDNVVLAESHIF